MGKQYKCENCNNVYKSGWTEEERDKEARELWGDLQEEEKMIVCDDCFKLLMAFVSKQ